MPAVHSETGGDPGKHDGRECSTAVDQFLRASRSSSAIATELRTGTELPDQTLHEAGRPPLPEGSSPISVESICLLADRSPGRQRGYPHVLTAADNIFEREDGMREELRRGVSVKDAYSKYGSLQLLSK